MKKFKLLSLVCALTVASTLFVGCGGNGNNKAGSKGKVNVFNCGDYIDEDLLQKFEDETGIEVVYSTYETNEQMYSKVSSGSSNYDIVVPSDYMIEKMIKEDKLEKINFDNIPNYKYIGEDYKNLPYDPKNEYSVPYMWGTIGILYNPELVSDPVDSWDILWNEKYNKNIIMFDSVRDTMAIALKKNNFSMNSKNKDEINKATDDLIKQAPLVYSYLVDNAKTTMIDGGVALCPVWSGDAVYSIEQNPDLKFAIPKEGTNKWFDGFAIPKGAQNKANAEAFINFMLDPENSKQNVDYIGYNTPNTETFKMLSDEQKAFYPSKEILDKSEVFTDLGTEYTRIYDEAWTRIKSQK